MDLSNYLQTVDDYSYNPDIPEAYRRSHDHLEDAISACKTKLSTAEEEIADIQEALDTKWR